MKGIQKVKRSLKQASPTILTCIGAIGVVATSVMFVKATPKVIFLLEQATEEKGKELTKLEVARIAGPVYIPALVIGASTIACIFGANMLSKHNQASLASAYAMLNQSYQRYRKAANSVYGYDADSKIKAQVAKETYVSADGHHIYSPEVDQDSEHILFYESFSQQYFTSTMSSVLNAQYHANRNFTLRGDVTLNEFYEFLGIDKVDCGDDIGWSADELMESGIMWIDFENTRAVMDDGLECYVISSMFEPVYLYCSSTCHCCDH